MFDLCCCRWTRRGTDLTAKSSKLHAGSLSELVGIPAYLRVDILTQLFHLGSLISTASYIIELIISSQRQSNYFLDKNRSSFSRGNLF